MIPPVLRSKHRYIVFQVLVKSATENQVVQALRQAVLSYLGESGYSKAEFAIVEYDHTRKVGIARTTDRMKDETVFALSLLDSVQGKKAGLLVLGVSGTVKKAREKFWEKMYLKEMLLNN